MGMIGLVVGAEIADAAHGFLHAVGTRNTVGCRGCPACHAVVNMAAVDGKVREPARKV